jgi:hypothetical protein
MIWLRPLLVGALLFTAGCERYRMLKHATTYDRSEIAWSKGTGTAQVQGVSTWRYRGKSLPCLQVLLIPKSTYADESILRVYGNDEKGEAKLRQAKFFVDTDPGYEGEARHAPCDGTGNFSFSSLPAGSYYVVAPFRARTFVNVVGGANYSTDAGVTRMQRVDVGDNTMTQIDLN